MPSATDVIYKRGQAYVWIQPNGPGTPYLYLNCAGLDALEKSEGDITPLYCKDEARAGRFRVRDSVQGEPSPVTTSLILPYGKAANYMFGLKCPFNLQVRFTVCERPDDPSNWDKLIHVESAKITNRATDQVVARTPGDEAEILTTLQLSAEDMFEVNLVEVERQTTTETEGLNDVAFVAEDECASTCGPATTPCQTGYIASDSAPYAATADVLKTTDSGGTWAATSADPFAASEDISAVVVNGDRVVVARGSTDAGNPAEIAYSDDGGDTWTLVNVGSLNAQTVRRMFWLARPYLWAVASSGYVFFSDDGGLSWTTQDAGAATAQQLNDVDFINSRVGWAVGNSNACIRTDDGGDSWLAVTGPAVGVVLNAVTVIDEATVMVAAADGNLYKTTDKGVTWTTLTFSGAGTGNAKDVEMYNASFGFLLHNNASGSGRIFRTVDGGKTWTNLGPTAANNGLNRISVCDQNRAEAVGEFAGSSSLILSVN